MVNSPSALPQVQRLRWEDYADAANWQAAMQGLINNLNLFITPTYNILNGQVGYQNVVVPQLFAKVITGASPTTFTFVNPLSIAPSAVLIGNVWSGVPSVHPAVALSVFWHYTAGSIIVDNIVGLTAGTVYTVTLVIL